MLIFMSDIAHSGHGSWNLYLPTRARLWLVPVRDGYRFEYLLGTAQCHRVDEVQGFPLPEGFDLLHRYCGSLLAILGFGDLCQLYVLQQHQ